MKIKLTNPQLIRSKRDRDFYGVKIGGIYEVIHQYKCGDVIARTPNGMELPLFPSEFEIISED